MTISATDHLVIFVNDIEEAIHNWTNLGLTLTHRNTVEEVSIHQAFFLLPDNSFIELMAPSDSKSPVQNTLNKHGEGVHTVALQVEDLESSVKKMQAKGVEVIGAGTDQVFIHPRSANGVRIQLWDKQRPHRWQTNPSQARAQQQEDE